MTPDTIPQSVLFPDLFDKPLVATFNQEHASSDGGAVLLKAAERVYGLVKAFARCLADKRAPGKIRHTLADLIGQRVFGIACGHPDGNDADHLADDPIHKLLLGRDPVSGAPLASQPTISRFENGARRTVLYRMGRELAACVIERHRRRLHGRARRITIDLDPTDDLTHGAQQLTFFNGHYGGWCYLPMLGFLSFDREAEQYLCAAVLRPGKAVAANGTLGLLCRLLPLLRAAFPRARFLVRLDGGFATPEIFDFLDAEPRLDYVVAMAKNAVLQRHAESAMQVARAQSEVGGETAHVYTDTRYAARTWGHERRVVIKAEVVRLGDREPRDNPRFVVTNLRQTPRFIYEKVYCARGDIENRIKELLDGLQIDRTSCCLFSANQLRVFLTAAAYVLMQELRLRAARTACARSQVTWLRDRLLKLGVHDVVNADVHLPKRHDQVHDQFGRDRDGGTKLDLQDPQDHLGHWRGGHGLGRSQHPAEERLDGAPGSDNGCSVNQPRPENPRFSGGFRRIDSFIAPDLRLEVGSNRSPSRPGTRRLPADRRRSRPGSGAPLRGRGPGRRPSPPSTVRGVAATGSSPDQVRLERGRLDAGDRVVGEGILTRPRRPARIEEGAEGGSAPARVLKAGGRGQCIVSPSSPSSRSASSASASTIPT